MAVLPPVEQVFEANAEAFLATIDSMVAACDRLAESIDEVAASADRLGGGADAAAAGDDRVAEAADMATEAVDRQVAAMDELAAALDRTSTAVDANAAAVDDNTAALDANAGSADRAGESAVGFGAKGKIAFLAVAAAVAYSVVKAAEYQSQMTTLLTQAGVARSQFGLLESGVLKLAGVVGFAPTSLAQALYHIESAFQSSGITGAKALQLLKIGAEGAAVGHSDLVDTVNALDAIMVAALPGIHSYSQAMGQVNAIIGAGDMTMEDFAKAASTGLFAVAKSYGQSLTQVGAAIAVFGDSNIRGAKAATDLRMAWQAVGAPLTTSKAILASLGLQYDTLADTMRKHGLSVAIGQFIDHLKAAKVPMSEWGQLETEIFGKRAGVGIGVLIGQFSRLEGKLPDIERGAHNFGSAWNTTNKTLSQQWKDLRGSIDALTVSFGDVLLPAVTKVVGWLVKLFNTIEQHPLIAKLAGALIALAAVTVLASGAMAGLAAISGAIIPALVIAAVVALAIGLYELYHHSKMVRDALADVARFFKAAWNDAVKTAGDVLHWFVSGPLAWLKAQLAVFTQFWQQHGAQIEQVAKQTWALISTIITTAWDAISGFLKAGLSYLLAIWKASWDFIVGVIRLAWNLTGQIIHTAIQLILGIIGVGLDLMTGHWSKAGDDLQHLTSTIFDDVRHIIATIVGGFAQLLFSLGQRAIEGLINGIKSMFGAAVGAVEDLGKGIVSGISSILHIHSPSKVMEEIGQEIGAGLIQGLEGTAADVKSAASKLASLITQALSAGDIGYQRATSLTAYLERDNTRLQTLATQRAAILKTITTAENYATSTTSNVESWAGLANNTAITSASSAGGGLYSGDILASMQASLTTIRQFTSALKQLKKLGLNNNLLNQIIQMGPQQGLQVAQALIDGPVSVIKSMNQTQTAINSAATSLGQSAADAMYDSGKDAGKGFLSGLEGQQAAIEKLMEKIAKGMVSTIKRELGIRSPSTVGHYHGLMWAAGIAAGMKDGEPMIDAAGKQLALAMGHQPGPMLTAAANSGAGGDTWHVQLTVNGFVGNNQELLRELTLLIQKGILQQAKRNGGNNLSLAAGRYT